MLALLGGGRRMRHSRYGRSSLQPETRRQSICRNTAGTRAAPHRSADDGLTLLVDLFDRHAHRFRLVESAIGTGLRQ